MRIVTNKPMRVAGGRLLCVVTLVAGIALAAAGQNRSVTINTAPIIQTGGGSVRVGGIYSDNGDGVRGSGKEATEERKVGTFTALHISVAARVEVTVGRPLRLTLTGDNNILPLILTEVHDRTLRVKAKESYTSQRELVVAVDVPSLSSVRVEGAGDVAIKGLNGSTFTLDVSGAYDVVASGTVGELAVTVNGAGDANLKALTSSSARIEVNGAGNCSARVRDAVEAIISGVGEIRIYGRPGTVKKTISGVGEVIFVDDAGAARPVKGEVDASAKSAVALPQDQASIVDGDSATYVGTVIGQRSGQVSGVVDSSGNWAGTVKSSADGKTAEFFSKDGEMRSHLRAIGKQTIGVFSPTGNLDMIILERTAPDAAETTDAPPLPEKSPHDR